MFDTTDELLRQIQLGEDSSLELKDLRYRGDRVVAPNDKSMADALAAMANASDGVFVLGVDDKTRSITGIPDEKLDFVENWLRHICDGLITPQLFCLIRKLAVITDDGCARNIIRVDVPKSLFIHQSPGGYFERIGAAKRQLTPDRLARLFQQRSQSRMIYFDEQAVTSAPENCLKKSLWGQFVTPLSPADDRDFLLKLKLLTKGADGNIYPSVSGVLTACECPQDYLPSAFIQAVAYRGTERNADYQLDARDITGPLDHQIAEAYHFVRKNMRIGAIKRPARQDIPQYSMSAVFEALTNAVAHRDYSIHGSKIRLHLFENRLELFSPGSIPNTMTIESLPLRQSARNDLLCSLLARSSLSLEGYDGPRGFLMDRRGEGVPIILTESEKLSGRRPEYRLIDESELMLTIYAAHHKQSEE
ncbi:MAG: putative DNA binding domain-containing protein [Oscillospiraceae bacterium]|jgi:predicted HTH transcriptional regulator|nr:putative DNA binding domain-containing protein [Oscillospiraceae bacterium]